MKFTEFVTSCDLGSGQYAEMNLTTGCLRFFTIKDYTDSLLSAEAWENLYAFLQEFINNVSDAQTSNNKGNNMTVKEKILQANENIKATAQLFSDVYNEIKVELDPGLIENSNMALGELIKCIKHLALIQGDITGHELMPPSEMAPSEAKPNDAIN